MLKKGDLTVIYTDGITEARRIDGFVFGEQRFAEHIQRMSIQDRKRNMRDVDA